MAILDFSLILGVYFFLIGIAAGSFLNVVILRGERGESLGGRSRCEGCKKTLSFFELIPIVSFLIQKGRCRSCGVRLFWQYPLVELGTGILFGIAGWAVFSRLLFSVENFILLLGILIALAAAIVIFVSDLKFYTIPNGAFFTLFALGIFATLIRNKLISFPSFPAHNSYPIILNSLSNDLIAALVFSLFFAALWLASKGKWMGLGDAKLFFAAALMVGFPLSLAAFLFSFWLGALAALILLFLGRRGAKDIMPFGPFILVAAALSLFWGPEFIRISGLYDTLYLLSF